MDQTNRILGHILGEEEGPLFICIGGIHGNEKAGIDALKNVFKKLNELEVPLKGEFVGIAGNLNALREQSRFMEKDLNRQFTKQRAQWLAKKDEEDLINEDLEQKELLMLFQNYIVCNPHKEIFMMDLHTTSATGGTFSIATSKENSQKLALRVHVPVILGLEDVLKGTTLHYFNEIGLTAFGFEAGQHDDPLSVSRMEAAIILSLEGLGNIEKQQIPEFDDLEAQLIDLRADRPKEVNFIYRHEIKASDEFKMKSGYSNFKWIEEGEHLADDQNGPIYSKVKGMILMPLYQPQGEDGFFIVQGISNITNN